MPIYEYQCQQCGLRIEKRQSVSDAPLSVCEKCHGKLEKQVSLSGFQFKGAGWYVTDYAGAKKGPGSEKSGAVESTSSGDSASKPSTESATKETKPAKTASKESST